MRRLGVWKALVAIVDFLAFWRPLDPSFDPHNLARRLQRRAVDDHLAALRPEALAAFTHASERSYDELSASVDAVQTRAANLLVALGVLSALIAVALSAIAMSQPKSWSGLVLFVAIGILYLAIGTFVLAIRAQSVGQWSVVTLRPIDFENLRRGQIEYAGQLFWSISDNRARFRNTVGYLHWAHEFAFVLLVLLGSEFIVALAGVMAWPLPAFEFQAYAGKFSVGVDMEAVIALSSAVVGGVVVAFAEWLLQRAAFRREDRAAVRTVFSELSDDYLLLTAMKKSGFIDGSLLRRLIWDDQQPRIANILAPVNFDLIKQAYAQISVVRLLMDLAKAQKKDFFKDFKDLVEGLEADMAAALDTLAKQVGSTAELEALQKRWDSATP